MAGKPNDDLDRSQECICGAHVVIAGNGSRFDAAPGPMGTVSPVRGRYHSCARPPETTPARIPEAARPREIPVALPAAPKDMPVEGEFYEVEDV